MNNIRIGTCSWKYDSWKGILYPEFGEFNYLEEYSRKLNTVEIDQWFWSLHPNNKITLPKSNIVNEYFRVTPDDFKFTIKVPNSITLTHPYKSKEINPHFLSIDLMEAFLDSISILKPKLGILMFQFEYLNKQKMSSQIEFQHKLEVFFSRLNREYNYAVEIRNHNYLNQTWFNFLNNHDISHVFLEGYYLPHIVEIYRKFSPLIKKMTVLRLHGFDRKGIEQKTNSVWNHIAEPKDIELNEIIKMLKHLSQNKADVYLNVNNHYEGSAPLTIDKIKKMFG